ncbi:HAMP domain-containing histidine kinase [bacterium LRH843]|nr:HAMP domain-containing histidine kinase [bacterium LRH843]
MSMNTPPSSSNQYTNVTSSFDDEIDKKLFLLKQLDTPYLKLNNNLVPLQWNESFLEMTNTKEIDLHMHTLVELGMSSPLVSFCVELVYDAISLEEKQEDDFEDEDSLLHIRANPCAEDSTIYLIIEDYSLQKQFENLLTFHHQMEAASHIAAGVAHELRNPLSVIKGFLQLAKLTEDFHKYYDTILSELNRMNGIIEDFLSVSRKNIDRKWQSPVGIMESLMEIIKAECLLHNVELKVYLTETTHLVNVNESMIKQVMLNLLRNSIEAYGNSNTNRALKIDTALHNGEYRIYVKDNGKGMPESVLNQIGKPFFTTKESGTGIGVPLCKKIIEDHGGSFQIDSTYNVGTVVTIALPTD